MFAYPVDEHGLYRWILFLMVGYVAIAYAIGCLRSRSFHSTYKRFITRIFDSVTFAGSTTLFWGLIDETILKLIGSTYWFLLIAGFAGLGYSLHALFAPNGD